MLSVVTVGFDKKQQKNKINTIKRSERMNEKKTTVIAEFCTKQYLEYICLLTILLFISYIFSYYKQTV